MFAIFSCWNRFSGLANPRDAVVLVRSWSIEIKLDLLSNQILDMIVDALDFHFTFFWARAVLLGFYFRVIFFHPVSLSLLLVSWTVVLAVALFCRPFG